MGIPIIILPFSLSPSSLQRQFASHSVMKTDILYWGSLHVLYIEDEKHHYCVWALVSWLFPVFILPRITCSCKWCVERSFYSTLDYDFSINKKNILSPHLCTLYIGGVKRNRFSFLPFQDLDEKLKITCTFMTLTAFLIARRHWLAANISPLAPSLVMRHSLYPCTVPRTTRTDNTGINKNS